MTTMNDNPLLDFSGLPRFAELKPEHVTPAVDQLLAEGRATVAAVSVACRADSVPRRRRFFHLLPG